MEKFQISCLANVEKCSEEGELTLVRALPETGIEGSIGVHQAAKADTAPAQAQRQEIYIAQHSGGFFFLVVS